MRNIILTCIFLLFICSQINALVPASETDTVGIRHSLESDMTIQRRPDWSARLSLSSSRAIIDKRFAPNNFADYYTTDGALYTYIDGDEYDNIATIWDWQKVPGVTAYQTNDPSRYLTVGSSNNSTFAGNVNNGTTGISAMQLHRDGLRASKAWIFTDDFILCLGAGIHSDNGLEVVTSIDQRLLKTDIKELKGYRWVKTTATDFDSVPDIRFFHDKTGYIILKTQGGRAVAQQGSDAQKMFSLWLNQGKNPQSASYAYLILPAKTSKDVKNFDLSQVKILSNTPRLQSVRIGNTTYVAAYPLVDMNVMEGVRFQSSNTGLFMIEEESTRTKMTVVDPTQLQTQMEVSLHGQKKIVQLPSGDQRGMPAVVYFDKAEATL